MMRSPLRGLALAPVLAAALGGCGTGAAQRSLAPAPPLSTSHTTPATGATATDVPSDPRVELQQIVAYAERHSPEVMLAEQRQSLGAAEVEAASPAMPENPEIEGGVGYRTTAEGSGLDFQVSASQAIPVTGERGARVRAAKSRQRALRAELDLRRWQVRQNVRREYRLALVDRERARLAKESLKFAERLLEIARERQRAGEISQLPVTLAEAEVAQARERSIAAEAGYEARRVDLGGHAGWPAAAEPPEPVGELARAPRLPSLERVLSRAGGDHPGVRAHTAELEARRASLSAEDRATWPSPRIGAGFAREAEPGARRPATIWSVALTLPLPVWQRNQGARARARAQTGVAEAELVAYSQNLAIRLRRLRSRVEAAARRIEAYAESALPKLSESLTLTERSFAAGESELLDVLTVRGRVLAAQEQALQVYADFYEALAELEAQAGIELDQAEARQ